MRYQQYNLKEDARLALNYLDGMTDRKYDYLPFWLTLPHKKPAEAEHCRVDDAELVASWFEAVDSIIGILGKVGATEELYNGFRAQVLSNWGEHGLRYHKKYPWTHTIHSAFHEMGYVLPALNRLVKNDPNDAEAEKRASELVRGMRSLVIERKLRTFWSGDTEEKEPIYEFPNDVYLWDGGFDLTRHTGRGEQSIRNAVMLHSLVDRYCIANDEVALDLAKGLANQLLGVSRYFNYKYEYYGHVHSSTWVAAGLIYLGRVTGNRRYLNAGENIYKFSRSMSSSFGWVPEFAQWKAPELEHCETCCLKDMILCCYELIKCGKTEYWNDLNLFARNQLTENQIKYTGYVVCDNSLDDENGRTFRDLDKRLIGGYSGGSEPNSISLVRFRSIAGCCIGTAPTALQMVWDNTVTDENGILTVNVQTEKETDKYALTHEIPDNGVINLALKAPASAGFRIYEWMGKDVKLTVNGKAVEAKEANGILYAENLNAGDVVTLTFPIETVEKKEFFAGKEYTEFWRGCDMIDILPHGDHVRLYQRDLTVPKVYPLPEDLEFTGTPDRGPTQQANINTAKK